MTCGIITIAMGAQHVALAGRLISSLRLAGDYAGPIRVITDDAAEFGDCETILVPDQRGLYDSRLYKTAIADYSPWDLTAWIDADCIAERPVSSLFGFCSEETITIGVDRHGVRNTGVFTFPRTAQVLEFFAHWHAAWKRGPRMQDQPPFEEAMEETYLPLAPLSPVYNHFGPGFRPDLAPVISHATWIPKFHIGKAS